MALHPIQGPITTQVSHCGTTLSAPQWYEEQHSLTISTQCTTLGSAQWYHNQQSLLITTQCIAQSTTRCRIQYMPQT